MRDSGYVTPILVGFLTLLLVGQAAGVGRAAASPVTGPIRVAGLMEPISDQEAKVAQFVDAARRGDLELVKKLVAENMDVNAANRWGETALMEACAEGHLDVVSFLLDHKAGVALRDNQGQTALHKAFVGTKGKEIYRLMEEKGVLEGQSFPGLLATLVLRGQAEDLNWIMHTYPDERRSLVQEGGLSYACLSGDPEKIKILLDAGADQNEDGGAPLLQCVRSRSVQGAKLILEKGAKVNEPPAAPPLWLATDHGHVEMVKLFLEYGADANVRNPSKDDRTPLIQSLETSASKYDEVMTVLLDAGADTTLRDRQGWTPLMWAGANGRVFAVKKLLSKGADVNAETPLFLDQKTGKPVGGGESVLWLAAAGGSKEVLEELLSRGARVNKESATGISPLMIALRKGWEDAAQCLLDKGADVHARARNGYNCVIAAAMGGSAKLLKSVLERITDPNIKNIETMNWALEESLFEGHGAVAAYLLDKGADSKHVLVRNQGSRDEANYTMLMLAAIGGSKQAVDLLLERGLHVNAANSEGKTALWFALAEGHPKLSRHLIEKGADPKRTTKDGSTMLMAAARGGVLDFMSQCLDRGENVNTRTADGSTPLHEACRANRIVAARLLLARGADFNGADRRGVTPLMIAVDIERDATLLRELLARGADPNLALPDGTTPLMLAIFKDSIDAAAILTEYRAEIDAVRPSDGMTALAFACSTGNRRMAQYLLEKGANPHVKLKDGRTLFELARSQNKPEVEQLLALWTAQHGQ